jgi:hypothetical protein
MRSMKGATGSGFREGADAAHQNHRMLRPALGGSRRYAREAEHPDEVDVVALVGHREADEVEVGEGPERLQRERHRFRAKLLVEVFRIAERTRARRPPRGWR